MLQILESFEQSFISNAHWRESVLLHVIWVLGQPIENEVQIILVIYISISNMWIEEECWRSHSSCTFAMLYKYKNLPCLKQCKFFLKDWSFRRLPSNQLSWPPSHQKCCSLQVFWLGSCFWHELEFCKVLKLNLKWLLVDIWFYQSHIQTMHLKISKRDQILKSFNLQWRLKITFFLPTNDTEWFEAFCMF